MKTAAQIESKQRYLTRSLLFLVAFSAPVFEFSSGMLRAEETPLPPATHAEQETVGISPTPSLTVPFSVHAVGVWKGHEKRHVSPETHAGRGDTIWLDIINFEDWVNSLDKKPDDHEIKDLVLYLDHFPLLGVSPIYWYKWPPQYTAKGKDESSPIKYSVTTVGFPLVRNEGSKDAWSHVLNQPVLDRRVIVSAGFKSGEEIPSEVTPDKITGEDQQFDLTIIPMFRTLFGFVVILGALIAFFALSRYTDIIRDTAAPRRPDGQRPVQPGARPDGILVFSCHRFLFLSLDCYGRHEFA